MYAKITGTYMGAGIRTRKGQNGQPDQSSIIVDIYQAESTAPNKAIQVQLQDVSVYQKLVDKYKPGSPVEFTVTARAYNSNIYLNHDAGLI